ncbi:MAG: XTP/dITP diphosphatase [Desulfurococcaceae archaeon]
MNRICVVTSNKHKFEEILEVAKEYSVELEMCEGFKLELQADNIEDVVLKSAMLAHILLNRPVLVEDAGLFIEALNGFPGPYSSYVYRTIGIDGILKLLNGVENRKACFKSAVTLVHDKGVFTSTGEVCGVIPSTPRGSGGFGFDPIFVPSGETRTFAEMSIREKNLYSHRAKAVRRVFESLIKVLANAVHL